MGTAVIIYTGQKLYVPNVPTSDATIHHQRQPSQLPQRRNPKYQQIRPSQLSTDTPFPTDTQQPTDTPNPSSTPNPTNTLPPPPQPTDIFTDNNFNSASNRDWAQMKNHLWIISLRNVNINANTIPPAITLPSWPAVFAPMACMRMKLSKSSS